jgi:hypothetical protein
MRDWYHNYGHLTHIDATYCVMVENFLYFTAYVKMKFKWHTTCILFHEKYNKRKFRVYNEKLNSEVSKNGQIVMEDKDLSNISLISQFFVNVFILICTFHVAKYFKTHTRKDEMEVPNNKKSLLYDVLSKCFYTNDLSKYINFYD